MPLWNRIKQELDRSGKVAQDALDEGKVRLEAFRARQLADKAAQALGYALYRARKAGADLAPDVYERLSTTLATHESEASRLEATLQEIARTRRGRTGGGTTAVTPYEPPGSAPWTEPPSPPPAAAEPGAAPPTSGGPAA